IQTRRTLIRLINPIRLRTGQSKRRRRQVHHPHEPDRSIIVLRLISSIYHELLYMPSEGSAVFEKQIDGQYALNKNMKLGFCANFSPACLSTQVTTTAYSTHIMIQCKSNR
ncbi:Protein CBG21595, partial [Caenorhabditis briggsae]